jgi:hypothetical protein
VWYCISALDPAEKELWEVVEKDVRVETAGQWTRGTCVTDRRGRARMEAERYEGEGEVEVIGDAGRWLGGRGNRVGVCVRTPGFGVFQGVLLGRVFGVGV